jgi:hypothetical protein
MAKEQWRNSNLYIKYKRELIEITENNFFFNISHDDVLFQVRVSESDLLL